MNGSYQFEALDDRHREAACLAERATMRLEGFIPLLRRHGFDGTGRVLDVGCAQGLRSRRIAESFPRATVLGIDRSAELLAQADTGGLTNLSFAEADLYELPFADHGFDFVYARLVFMHLSEPQRALASLARVLRPGGRILIEDADRDCMFFEPAPPSFAEFWRGVQEGQRRRGGDPNVGRKLAPLLKSVGFSDVRVETQSIIGGGAEIAFLVRTLMPSLSAYLEPEARSAGADAIADLAELAKRPDAAFYHFWFTVSAAAGEVQPDRFRIAPARAGDVPVMHQLIRELADYERSLHLVETTPEALTTSLFGDKPQAEAVIAWEGGHPVGLAVFFHSYSTWLGRHGLYLEDLFVVPSHRGKGYGRALLHYLAKLAVDRGCGRFEWAVLDWNDPAIAFYTALGARPVDESTIYRLSGDALQRLAEPRQTITAPLDTVAKGDLPPAQLSALRGPLL